MNQTTTYIGSTLIREYSHNGRYAHVNTHGQVFGYPTPIHVDWSEPDYSNHDKHSTNVANELAIAYVLNGGK